MKAPESDFDAGAIIKQAVGGVVVLLAGMSATARAGQADGENALDAPLSYFLHSFGPAARPTMHLGWFMTGLLSAITLIVALLLVVAIWRRRPAADQRTIGPESGGVRWVYIGTGISTCILAGLVVYSLLILNAVAKPSQEPALILDVTGYDWWWKVEYIHPNAAHRFVTANEIHIPTGVPVLLKLNSADVIHAFWVPVLAGKMQMIPGLTNQTWMQADTPGIYLGQCTQFCGVGHAHMRLEVVAEDAGDFRKWEALQRQAATAASALATDRHPGYELFMERCAGCHAIRGTEARGEHGPDLTHLKSRRRLAAGLLTNTPERLMDWITRAQRHKPGARMPSIDLSKKEAAALAVFLSTLD